MQRKHSAVAYGADIWIINRFKRIERCCARFYGAAAEHQRIAEADIDPARERRCRNDCIFKVAPSVGVRINRGILRTRQHNGNPNPRKHKAEHACSVCHGIRSVCQNNSVTFVRILVYRFRNGDPFLRLNIG